MSKTTDKVTTFSVANATNSAVDLSVSNQFDYGISAEYQRSNYDSPTARKDFFTGPMKPQKTNTVQSALPTIKPKRTTKTL